MGIHMPYHTLLRAIQAEVTFPPLPQPKLVLDLERPQSDARLSWPGHCSEAQSVSEAAYRSNRHDKQPSAVRFEPGSSRTAGGRANH